MKRKILSIAIFFGVLASILLPAGASANHDIDPTDAERYSVGAPVIDGVRYFRYTIDLAGSHYQGARASVYITKDYGKLQTYYIPLDSAGYGELLIPYTGFTHIRACNGQAFIWWFPFNHDATGLCGTVNAWW